MQGYKINKYSILGVVFSAVLSFNMMTSARAEDINAGYVLNKMNADQKVSYLIGVIEGLAISRYFRDKPDQSGMKCFYEWYKESTASNAGIKKIDTVFAKYPDRPVGILLYILIKKKCGA